MSLQARLATMGITIETGQFPLTQFRFPVMGLLFYLLTIALFSPDDAQIAKAKREALARKQAGEKERFGKTRTAMLVHNAVLCVFSAACFYVTAPIVFDVYRQDGWTRAITHGLEQAHEGPFGYWTWLFYLSKFWEFIDSWIVIARGRKPIFLQVYHHVGAVLGMWLVVTTKASCAWLFVCFNSFIHTVMYFYYCLSVLKVPVKSKNLITILQLVQFVCGVSLCIAMLFTGVMRFEDAFCGVYHVIYVTVLFVMFVQFYRRTYGKKNKNKSARKPLAKEKEAEKKEA